MVSQARWSTYQSPRKLRSTAIFIQQLITVKGELALDPTAEEANSKCSNHMSSTWQVKMVGNWNSTPKSLLSWPSVSRIAPALRNSREAFFEKSFSPVLILHAIFKTLDFILGTPLLLLCQAGTDRYDTMTS